MMNKYILIVMKWLRDNSSVAKEDLNANYNASNAAANAAAYASNAAANAAANASSAANAVNVANAANVANSANADAAFWVDKYFVRSGENKQDYIDKIKNTSTVTTDNQSKIDRFLDLAFELLSRKEYEKIKESTNRVRKCPSC